MSTHKHIDKICCVAVIISLLITAIFMNGESLGLQASAKVMGYENRLFDTSTVHTIDIIMDDWDSFIDTCQSEEYSSCTVIIDGESYKNVGIRGKGNTSLSTVSSMDSERYSFKVEFDQYDSTMSYHGLDKLSLNNVIQDNTYMKDYLVYQMMGAFGVDAPLCSYVYITVNGEDWGLYLAVEGIENSFLQRNYGNDYGELYKPDSMSFGGGRGNGRDFNMEDFDFSEMEGSDSSSTINGSNLQMPEGMEMPEGMQMPEGMEMPEDMQMPEGTELPEGMELPEDMGDFSLEDFQKQMGDFAENMNKGGGFGGMGSEDVKLQYIDDNPDSYSNIFNNAKTDITDADQQRLIESLEQLSNYENIENIVDIEEVIRYFVVHNFVVNDDSYTGMMIHNYYLYEEDGKFSMIPWDYNLAFGTFQGSNSTSIVNNSIDFSDGSMEDRPMLNWIFENEEYTELYYQYFSEFISEFFDTGYVSEMIDTVSEMIAPYVEKDPTKFCTYEEFELGISTIKQFCQLRAESVSNQLAGNDTSVDASAITLTDMGTMNMGGGGNMAREFGEGGNMQTPGGFGGGFAGGGMTRGNRNGFTNSSDTQTPEGTSNDIQIPEGTESPEGFDPASMTGGSNMQAPEGTELPEGFDPASMTGGSNMQSGISQDSLILLVTSGIVLLIGLLFAYKYRRNQDWGFYRKKKISCPF